MQALATTYCSRQRGQCADWDQSAVGRDASDPDVAEAVDRRDPLVGQVLDGAQPQGMSGF
jgi:hypothetical protein